jgi:hypothetical protein
MFNNSIKKKLEHKIKKENNAKTKGKKLDPEGFEPATSGQKV